MGDRVYKISDELKESARDCCRNFSCLEKPKETMCPVEYLLEDKVAFIDKKYQGECKYVLSYGMTNICRCPVRKEFFRLHGL